MADNCTHLDQIEITHTENRVCEDCVKMATNGYI